ncbi:hypothetical protein A4X06_0g5347 [Tilletia controversa]|uniref:Integrase core domain-containing protein n=1 Tax=Tilletia controversa TaxID=13291 RepID=A0A8X7MRL2_9BASI|nr:hypothetical protein A4X06_0g5347 [Tilletia controversa]
MSGRLRVYIDSDTLCELVEKEFTDDVIVIMLGTSLRTVERRRAELGLLKRGGPAVSDDELYAAIRSTYALGFEAGERGMRGALRSIGLKVSRERLRVALREVDPQNLQARWAKTIRRREYYVPFVNSLWHIDGHYKLIKYKIVIHGGVDGKSRTVTFMQASPNNRAETVTACFLAATQQWGWPSRVRADHGGENLGVKGKMEEARGLGSALRVDSGGLLQADSVLFKDQKKFLKFDLKGPGHEASDGVSYVVHQGVPEQAGHIYQDGRCVGTGGSGSAGALAEEWGQARNLTSICRTEQRCRGASSAHGDGDDENDVDCSGPAHVLLACSSGTGSTDQEYATSDGPAQQSDAT